MRFENLRTETEVANRSHAEYQPEVGAYADLTDLYDRLAAAVRIKDRRNYLLAELFLVVTRHVRRRIAHAPHTENGASGTSCGSKQPKSTPPSACCAAPGSGGPAAICAANVAGPRCCKQWHRR